MVSYTGATAFVGSILSSFGVSVVEWLVILVPHQQRGGISPVRPVSVVEWLVILVPLGAC